jgi:REP element-mobilizing transposase RayT
LSSISRARRKSESGIYHIVSRGVGRQIIFEDDTDRQRYLMLLNREAATHAADVLAWCLMDNHVHLLVQLENDDLSGFMRAINSPYALYFNKRHKRVGHLMQGRFLSEPVDTDQYLLTVVRYIHQNPEKAGLAKTSNYVWSSYHEYMGVSGLTKTAMVLGILGGAAEFEAFHRTVDMRPCVLDKGRGRQNFDAENALFVAQTAIAPLHIEEVAALPREERYGAICTLKQTGLSTRQIELLTGVPKSVVNRLQQPE